MFLDNGDVYNGEYVNGNRDSGVLIESGGSVWTSSNFSQQLTSDKLAAPDILDAAYSDGFIYITLGQDSSDDPGIYAPLAKIEFSTMIDGTDTTLSVSPSSFEMAPFSISSLPNGTNLHNAVTLKVPSSSISSFDSYTEINVSYDGGHGNLADNLVLKAHMKPADLITDFKVGEDKIEVKGATQSDIAWIKSSSNDADTIVKMAGSESQLFLLDNVASTSLSSSDFTFV